MLKIKTVHLAAVFSPLSSKNIDCHELDKKNH